MKPLTICLDPGHGMGNLRRGIYDSGAVWAPKLGMPGRAETEAEIVMDWVNDLRHILQQRGHTVIRTRKDALDPAPVAQRAGIAKRYHCDVLLALHCNEGGGTANGTETFYRGTANRALALEVNDAVCHALGSRNRGVKLEAQSQHTRLAVLNFPRAVLCELAFLDHTGDRLRLLDENMMLLACEALADVLEKNVLPAGT